MKKLIQLVFSQVVVNPLAEGSDSLPRMSLSWRGDSQFIACAFPEISAAPPTARFRVYDRNGQVGFRVPAGLPCVGARVSTMEY